MSKYGDSSYDKNDLYAIIEEFLKGYSASELLQIVADAVEATECEERAKGECPFYAS